MPSSKSAEAVAKWQSPTRLWLDHATVRKTDLEWMAPAESLIMWNVRLPDEALASLPNLGGVSIRGGTGTDLHDLRGCGSLLWLDVNQVRGLYDLSELASLTSLEYLSLYGLPKVRELPSLRQHSHLRRVDVGSMKGMTSLAGLAETPNLLTLQFVRMVAVSEEDVELLAAHPTLRQFHWYWEDVPQRVALPVVERLSHLDTPALMRPEQWPTERTKPTTRPG